MFPGRDESTRLVNCLAGRERDTSVRPSLSLSLFFFYTFNVDPQHGLLLADQVHKMEESRFARAAEKSYRHRRCDVKCYHLFTQRGDASQGLENAILNWQYGLWGAGRGPVRRNQGERKYKPQVGEKIGSTKKSDWKEKVKTLVWRLWSLLLLSRSWSRHAEREVWKVPRQINPRDTRNGDNAASLKVYVRDETFGTGQKSL